MKAATVDTLALLASKQAIIADLFTIALLNGQVLTLTSAPDFEVFWLGNTYTRLLTIERGDITSTVGIEVDEVDLTLYIRSDYSVAETAILTAWFGSASVPAFVHNGGFDGARVLIGRAFMSAPGVPVGVIHLFEGTIYQPAPSRSKITMTVSADMLLLDQLVPKNVITPDCSNRLFDSLCTLNKTAYTATGTAQAGSNRNVIITALTQPDTYFRLGAITFTSGNNAGAKRSIKFHNSGNIIPSYPFYYPPAIGDSFEVVAGCDKTRAMCQSAKFGDNSANMRLFPFVPTPVASA